MKRKRDCKNSWWMGEEERGNLKPPFPPAGPNWKKTENLNTTLRLN